MKVVTISAQVKVWVATGLALVALVLVLVGPATRDEDREGSLQAEQPVDISVVQAQIDAEIDSLLAKHAVQVERSRKRTVPQAASEGGVAISRVEREVVVTKSFSVLDFNQQISKLGARYGIVVSARENPKQKTTSMDIRHGETTIESILFITKK